MKRIRPSVTRRFAVNFLNRVSGGALYSHNISNVMICELLVKGKLVDVELPITQKSRKKLLQTFYLTHHQDEKVKPVPRQTSKQRKGSAKFKGSPSSDAFLNSWEWTRLRYEALALHGRRCMCCGASPDDGKTILHVDHIKPRSKYPGLSLVLDNLQVLCSFCNKGKGAWDETDFRQNKKIIRDDEWNEILIAQSARMVQ